MTTNKTNTRETPMTTLTDLNQRIKELDPKGNVDWFDNERLIEIKQTLLAVIGTIDEEIKECEVDKLKEIIQDTLDKIEVKE